MKAHVLLLDGHTRQVLPMARWLRRAGHHVSVLCPNRLSVGFVSRWPNKRIIGPDAKVCPQGFLHRLAQILAQGGTDIVIPLFDHSAELLSRHKSELSKWARLAVNDYPVFTKVRDKLETMRICMEHGIPCPKTATPDVIQDCSDVNGFKFPVVIKPRKGDSAKGFSVVQNSEGLLRRIDETERSYGPCIVQEYIPQTDLQYKAELFIGEDRDVKAAVVFSKLRWYPLKGGSSTCNVTVRRPDIVRDCTRLLQVIGWTGYADIDLIQDPRDGMAKVLEVNPRITGSVRIAFDAGVDFADMIVRLLLQEPIAGTDYEVDRYLRFLHKDLLWFISSPHRFCCRPNWFKFVGHDTSDQIISFRDPLPGVAFTVQCVVKLLHDTLRSSQRSLSKMSANDDAFQTFSRSGTDEGAL